MASQSSSPVQPVPIIGAFVASDLDVPDDLRVCVSGQKTGSVAEVDSLAVTLPITAIAPLAEFVRVTPFGPLVQLAKDLGIHPIKGALGDTGAVVQRPAANDRIECSDDRGLWCASVLADDRLSLTQVSFTRFFAGLDERLETRLTPERTGVILAYPMLPDAEAGKVKADMPFVRVERVGDAGFAGLELQSHLG